jgi:homoserine kinase
MPPPHHDPTPFPTPNLRQSVAYMKITAQVPASSANLGPAFDCAAIALNLHLRVTATTRDAASPSPTSEILYRGPNADRITLDDTNLILRAMRNIAISTNKTLPAAKLEIDNPIPIGCGLGSSAAAIIAGTLLGAELCGIKLAPNELLRHALAIENHPDNVSAALYGGMVVAATMAATASDHSPAAGAAPPASEVIVSRTDVSPNLDFVAVTPDVPLPTEKARAALPAQYSRADVVHNLQRTALLTAAFFSGRGFTPEIFRDRIHQPYRAPLVPGIAACLEYRHDGLAGIFLSGAGSSIMAIATQNAAEIGEALVAEFRRHNVTAHATLLKADNRGAFTTP